MTITLRILLLAVSVVTLWWVIQSIRKSKVKIEDSIFWIGFSALLVIISLFPQLVTWGARVTGVHSEPNFLFLVVIFILIIKIFRMSMRISQLENKLQHFAQEFAIGKRLQEGDNKKAE